MPHILVVEDDVGTQTLFRALLRRLKIDCTVTTDGDGALEALRQNRFDAVILDIVLPRVDGFDVLRSLRSTSPGLLQNVLVCTALNPAVLAECDEVKLVGAVMFKPLDLGALTARLRTISASATGYRRDATEWDVTDDART